VKGDNKNVFPAHAYVHNFIVINCKCYYRLCIKWFRASCRWDLADIQWRQKSTPHCHNFC